MRSARQILAELLGISRRLAEPYEVGLGSSGGGPKMISSAKSEHILNIHTVDYFPSGCDGMATVQLYCKEIVPDPVSLSANSKLLIHAGWQSGLGGGDVEIDGSEGMILTFAANSSLLLEGKLVSSIDGEPLVVGSTYECEAVTKWYTSAAGGPARLALPSKRIEEGETAWWKIPAMARNVTLHAVAPGAYASIYAELATAPDPGAIRYSTPIAPVRRAIVNGVEWLRIRASVDTRAFPEFELWC